MAASTSDAPAAAAGRGQAADCSCRPCDATGTRGDHDPDCVAALSLADPELSDTAAAESDATPAGRSMDPRAPLTEASPDFGGLGEDIWELVVRLLSGRDAARLAGAGRGLRRAVHRARAAGLWAPYVCPVSGGVSEPASGRFFLELSPGVDLQAALDACPEGPPVSALLRPGTYVLASTRLRMDREVHIWGRKGASLVLRGGSAAPYVVRITAARATLDGVGLRGHLGGLAIALRGDMGRGPGGVSVCDCAIASCRGTALIVDGSPSFPVCTTVRQCNIQGDVILESTAGESRFEHNTVAGSRIGEALRLVRAAGVELRAVSAGTRVAHNVIRGFFEAGFRLGAACPADFALGPGNRVDVAAAALPPAMLWPALVTDRRPLTGP